MLYWNPLMVCIGSSRMGSLGIGGAMLYLNPLMVGIGMNRMESLDTGVGAMLCWYWMAGTWEICRTTLLCFGLLWFGSGVGTVGPVVDNGVL